MGRKSLYVSESDQIVWDAAEALAKSRRESLSGMVFRLLAIEVSSHVTPTHT